MLNSEKLETVSTPQPPVLSTTIIDNELCVLPSWRTVAMVIVACADIVITDE